MNIRIVAIHKSDAFYDERDELIGVEGRAFGFWMVGHHWYSFDFVPAHLKTPIHLTCANFERA